MVMARPGVSVRAQLLSTCVGGNAGEKDIVAQRCDELCHGRIVICLCILSAAMVCCVQFGMVI